MTAQKKLWILVNLIGGPLVLGSYTLGFAYPDGTAMKLWGEIPKAIIPLYTANMFVAATGYMFFSHYFLKSNELEFEVFGKRFGLSSITLAYVAILAASSAWMPLCLHAVHHSIRGLLPVIVVVLWTAALGSLFVLIATVQRHKVERRRGTLFAVIGAAGFCLQTVVLDATIWPWFFSI